MQAAWRLGRAGHKGDGMEHPKSELGGDPGPDQVCGPDDADRVSLHGAQCREQVHNPQSVSDLEGL